MMGDRFNEGKLRLDLFVPRWFDMIVSIYHGGGQKYYVGETLSEITEAGDAGDLIHENYKAITAVIQEMQFVGYEIDEIIQNVADVLEFGAKKYSPWNWAKGLTFMNLMGSANRHWYKHKSLDIREDEETGLPHIAHVLVNLLFMEHFINVDRTNELNDLMSSVL